MTTRPIMAGRKVRISIELDHTPGFSVLQLIPSYRTISNIVSVKHAWPGDFFN